MNNLGKEEKRHPGQLADMATLRRLYKQKLEISIDEATAILEKHQLGKVQAFKPLEANFMNAIFELIPERGEPLILKIQYRRGLGSLEAEHYVTHLLRKSTDLPVSDLCLLDVERDIFPYPYLLLNKLLGEPGRHFFEGADHASRMQLSEELGHIVRAIHSQEVKEPERFSSSPNRLNQWRRIVEEALLGDEAFRAEIAAVSSEFYPQFNELMASVTVPMVDEELVLLWCDPVFHNLLVKRSHDRVQVTGIYDFQAASYGSRIFDLIYVEGDFKRRNPPGVYNNTEYVIQFYKGYEEAGQTAVAFEDTHRILRDLILKAGVVRYWWDGGEILHPKTPDWLNDILTGLAQLSQK